MWKTKRLPKYSKIQTPGIAEIRGRFLKYIQDLRRYYCNFIDQKIKRGIDVHLILGWNVCGPAKESSQMLHVKIHCAKVEDQ
ncbi:hypothetical protein T10_10064, partial [Trichinella papuae]